MKIFMCDHCIYEQVKIYSMILSIGVFEWALSGLCVGVKWE